MRIVIALCILTATAAAGSHCHESSTIVGYSHCRHFGSWGVDHDADDVTLDTGIFVELRRVVIPETHDTSSYTADGPQFRLDGLRRTRVAAGGGLHIGLDIGNFIVGAEESAASGFTDAGLTSRDLPGFTSQLGVVDLRLIGGVRTRALRTTLRAEVASGAEIVMMAGACEAKQCLGTERARFSTELRVRADRWIGRYVTLGAAAGADVIAIGELSFTIIVTAHDLEYDGW